MEVNPWVNSLLAGIFLISPHHKTTLQELKLQGIKKFAMVLSSLDIYGLNVSRMTYSGYSLFTELLALQLSE